MYDPFYAWRYDADPILAHEITFGELILKHGTAYVYNGTDVDESTQKALNDFFILDRLCDSEKKFLVYWKRRLAINYPIYKQELEMWAERKTEKWFFDNYKDQTVTHDGTFSLDENTKADLTRGVKEVLENIFAGKTTGKTSGTSNLTHSGSDESTTDVTASGTTDNKDRTFAFNYPESNYSGGVIPYNLDNNPDVEFIDSQADAVRHGFHSDTSDTHSVGSDEYEDNGKTSGTSEGTTDNKTNQSVNTDTTQGETGSRDQDTVTHWTEITHRQGDNLNKLTDELIAQIPTTNFFLNLVKQLSICFETVRLEDEEREDLRNE